MNVKKIVVQYLRDGKFDGLWNAWAECGCLIDDLAPCGDLPLDCEPGYKIPCDCGECDYHVGPRKGMQNEPV